MNSQQLQLDVVVPTYNRKLLLRKALESFRAAAVPDSLHIAVVVVDNNSTDGTAAMVEELQADFPLTLRCIRETKQGLSHSRNAAIVASHADLVAFIDDDEEIDTNWFQVIAREFTEPAVEFIGGPYLANWVSPAPDWLPPGYHAVIGAIPAKQRAPINPEFGANLMGGNAVFRREVFDRVGLYSTRLGRSGKGLLSEEDADMQRRLETAQVFGMHVPDLTIRHYIAPERLTRRYHRRWVFWRGASQGVRDRDRPDLSVQYLLGVPRYRFGQAARGLLVAPVLRLRGKKGEAFRSELAAWDLIGFVYGKYFLRVDEMYGTAGQPRNSSAPVA